MNRRWRITGRFTTTSPLHVGDGDVVTHDKIQDQDGNKADVARVTRDWKTRPCIPGTAVKGVLRSWADWFFPQHKPAISKMFGTRDAAELMGEAGWAEFGTLFLQTPAPVVLERFDKYLPYWHKERLTGIASHVCINRHTGAAQKNKLYYEEFVPEGVVFNVEITATRLSETDIDLLLAILEQGARHPSHPYQFGANGADGWGRMDWTLGEVMTCGEVPTGRRAIGFGCCTTPYAHGELPKAGGPPAHQFLELTLAFEGPLLVNDASRAKEDGPEDARTNHTAMSRANGHVWLPASTFRGALRQRAEFLLRSLDPEATGDPNAPAGNGPIERIFGATSQASRLQIDEFTEIGKCPRPEERPKQDFVAIDRFTGGAADGLKFDARYADRPTLGTKMVLDTTGLDGKDLALFAAALEDLCAGAAPLGFGGSKGYGSCRGKLDAKSTTWLRGLDRSGLKPTEAAFQPTTTAQAVAAVQPTATVQPVAVATVKQGRLVWEGAGKTRRQSLAHQDGKTIYQLTPQRIRQDLRGVPDASVEVDYELERGQPIHIRPRGEPWEQAPKPGAGNNPAPASRSDRFANPYYFLPMKDRSALSGELKDRVPHGHERLISDLYSGSLRVRLTTETELLICGQPEKPELNGNGHQTYPLLLQDGKPLLASSSVRGMLRAAYEAVTNSRFGVFPAKPTADSILKRGNARRYGYRMEAGEGLGLVPVRMENGQARLMLGTNPHLPTWDHRKGRWEVPHGRLHAAWVARYKATGGAAERAVTINGRSPVHGEEAWCWLELVQHKNPFFQFWTVRQAASNEAALGQVAPPWIINGSPRYQSLEESRRAHGHFCVTNQNIGRKHDERFFFGPIEPLVRVRDDVKTAYEALIADYQAIHE
jgi:CRISPR/Cas system CSM-associated protein Csm3 (group 7 of RAMP superfamily)